MIVAILVEVITDVWIVIMHGKELIIGVNKFVGSYITPKNNYFRHLYHHRRNNWRTRCKFNAYPLFSYGVGSSVYVLYVCV